MKRPFTILLPTLMSVLLFLPGFANAAPAPKVTKRQAEAIALKEAPGRIVESDYEKEDGIWRWSFDIRQGHRMHEVGIDAMTGRIVESAYESAGEKD
ncbi:MAG: peptidase M4 [Betaproteobacteria bacterium]|nr:peptidase M4 [Betaproteobacteria bacterium]